MARLFDKRAEEVRSDTFAMRLNWHERQMLIALADQLQRTQSDTVRLLIRGAACEMGSARVQPQREEQ